MAVTIEDALAKTVQTFQEAGLESPQSEAEFLMASLLTSTRAGILLRRKQHLTRAQWLQYQEWALERRGRKPLAYVTGEQPFYGRSFKVTSDVLVPRPETELLVERALALLDRVPQPVTLIDVGTGSGAIAVSLAQHAMAGRVIGIDLCPHALKVAALNGAALAASRCEWRQGDLLDDLKEGASAFLITANLPYIRRDQIPQLEAEVQWEPALALDGGEDGLDVIRRLVQSAPKHLASHGHLMLEIGYDQREAVLELLQGSKEWEAVQVHTDFSGHPRIIQAQRKAGR